MERWSTKILHPFVKFIFIFYKEKRPWVPYLIPGLPNQGVAGRSPDRRDRICRRSNDIPARTTTIKLRCLARDPTSSVQWFNILRSSSKGRARSGSLDAALEGVHTAYYLVHLMSGSRDFEKEDRRPLKNFARASRRAGVRGSSILGDWGMIRSDLSPHLRSRHEVGQILRESGVETIEFRAGMVIGSGSYRIKLMSL